MRLRIDIPLPASAGAMPALMRTGCRNRPVTAIACRPSWSGSTRRVPARRRAVSGAMTREWAADTPIPPIVKIRLPMLPWPGSFRPIHSVCAKCWAIWPNGLAPRTKKTTAVVRRPAADAPARHRRSFAAALGSMHRRWYDPRHGTGPPGALVSTPSDSDWCARSIPHREAIPGRSPHRGRPVIKR